MHFMDEKRNTTDIHSEAPMKNARAPRQLGSAPGDPQKHRHLPGTDTSLVKAAPG
jgi:hypothetical protein